MVQNMTQCTDEELVIELNRLLAEEVEASLRYLHLMMSMRPGQVAGQDVAPMLQQAFTETLEHAQALGEKIRRLGGLPRLDIRLQCPPGEVSPEDAVQDVLTFEEAALEGYQELLERMTRGDAHADLLQFVREQVELETEHVDMFKKLR